jgi:phosphate transport system permease protein
MMDLYARRRLTNQLMIGFACGASLLGVFCLAEIMWTLLINGISAINLDIFIKDTPPPSTLNGGLRNAIFGSVAMTGVAILAAAPIGILAGTFLAEFAHQSRFGHLVRFVNDILLSSPSIIIGLFVYQLIVLRQHHFSAWAGAFALAMIALPVIVRTAEDMLSLVPSAQREAASALGAPKWRVIVSISFRAARQGLVTGILLAIARISGETAPLLFTALGNLNWSTDMNGQMASLPKVIFDFALSADEGWQKLAWGGALLITATILILNIGGRTLSNWSSNAK